MADIHQVITLGIGTPSDIPHVILFGLSPTGVVEFQPDTLTAVGRYPLTLTETGRYTLTLTAVGRYPLTLDERGRYDPEE